MALSEFQKEQRKNIGARIRSLRENRKMSQLRLAVEAEVAPNTVSLIERGKHKPRAAVLERIAAALEVSADAITGEGSGTTELNIETYRRNIIVKAIDMRIKQEAKKLSEGMNIDEKEVINIWRLNSGICLC